MIDSHCHLTFGPLLNQIAAVLERARAAGVTDCITVGTTIEDTHRALELAERWPCVHVTAGIHPHEAAKVAPGWDRDLEALARRPDVAAVGETGLDYHYDFADRPTQRRVFERELEIAAAVGKPVIIHCREAQADALDVLADFPDPGRVVFHCFTGTVEEARVLLDRGHWLSLTGVVTFKKSGALREVARLLPDDRLMVETDSPYLSPAPVRHHRPNEPAHVVHTARCIAEQRGLAAEALESLTVANTRRFFAIE
ncbi:MAG: TatD family hydrolase [Phycisphaerae bacterium]